jgi:hypothetical protein
MLLVHLLYGSGCVHPGKQVLLTCSCMLQVERLQRADKEFMDRVNMYSSFYVAKRK